MLTEQINIRDPYVLYHDQTYYLYGTESHTAWSGTPTGFFCHFSQDLETWQGPVSIFARPDDFFADRNFWAPECHAVEGGFVLLTTLGAPDRPKGVYSFFSKSPLGPFQLQSGQPLTPPDWSCIDGTLFHDKDGKPYLVFSHTFEDVPTGDMVAVQLDPELRKPAGQPFLLFSASDAPWARPVPFAKSEFGLDGDIYFTDGPCVHRMTDGRLLILWSAWSVRGYAVGQAVSESSTLAGPWHHLPERLFPDPDAGVADGGHGMLFKTHDGRLIYTLHTPNEKFTEHPVFIKLIEREGQLAVSGSRGK